MKGLIPVVFTSAFEQFPVEMTASLLELRSLVSVPANPFPPASQPPHPMVIEPFPAALEFHRNLEIES